jgi:hypothetical protein
MVQQVSGESNVEQVLAAGMYDNEGNLVTSWDDLVEDGKVVVEGTNLYTVDYSVSGTLVVPKTITSAGTGNYPSTFVDNGNIRVEFQNGFTSLGAGFYWGSGISDITIVVPTTLETIDYNAFHDSTSNIIIEYKGTKEEWMQVSLADGWGGIYGVNITVVCTDETITYSWEDTVDSNYYN